jgi:glycosyltransferase involved in cell wall biosynthesis
MAGANVLVLGNTLINHQPLGFEADMDSPVVRTWTWDNVRWQTSSIDMEQVRRVISVAHAELLIIQYHTAFFPFDRLVDIVSLANTLGTSVTIELHDARHMTAHDKETLCTLGATLLVHRREGVDGMSHAAQQLTRVFELPVRFREYQDNKEHERGINQRNELVIGGFGFLRPYKGILTSIRTLALLRQRYPHARYRGWHATYSGEGSSDYLRACLGEAERLGISDAVEIDTRFLPIDEVTSMLHKVDIVLLPYDPSDEGASAAARIAIAAARPTVTSPSAIFSSLSKVVRIADEHSASAYATAITQIANNAELAAEMRVNARAWAIQHNYRHSAEAMLHLSLPEHDDRRWHKDDVRL